MKKRTAILPLMAMLILILDSRCAAEDARQALDLCAKTLIPTLFPLFCVSTMALPHLSGLRIHGLARLLGLPEGCEGSFLLGCAGGFPVGALCTVQAYRSGGIRKEDAQRMLGLCSFCGPSFLFGILPTVLSMEETVLIFLIQLLSALIIGSFWTGESDQRYKPKTENVSLPEAVKRSIGSMAAVCAWVVLAAVAAGFLRRWLFPFLPKWLGLLLTGLLELTNGVFSVSSLAPDLRFLLTAVFVSFGGVSVLLQIAGVASELSMKSCIAQKALQALLSALLSLLVLAIGNVSLVLPVLVLGIKIAVEIPGRMVYNVRRKEGI